LRQFAGQINGRPPNAKRECCRRKGRLYCLYPTWHDTAEAIVGNWIGIVYQLTHQQCKLPIMEGADPRNPLGLDWIAGSHG
jgi:hypothetical protein